ncbi:GNAT family N-acetyltransferase [Methanococcoides sp. FTZ1]|uniref:GNAT family N-acetyltransferase n=1 Tax=Methanococcoides sp. FTZ1 TaxID=3439061 RepID=UPI003F844468
MSSEMMVRELETSEHELWDELVDISPYGTIFQKSDWLTICRDSFNFDLKMYGCFHNEELVGGCSLFSKRARRIFKVASSYCNMTPYGSILIKRSASRKVRNQEEFQNNVLRKILDHIEEQGFDQVSISNSSDFIDTRQFSPDRWTRDISYAYYFDLREDIDARMPKGLRTIIRRANENGILVKKEENIRRFYDLIRQTYEKQQLIPPADLDFFERIMEFLHRTRQGEMWIAEMPTGEVAAAEIIIWDNKRAHRWAATSDPELKVHNATSLLLYNIFRDLKSRDFKEINLMSGNTPKLTTFITGFNPELVPYYMVTSYSKKFDACRQIVNKIR